MKPINRASAAELAQWTLPRNSLKHCTKIVSERQERGMYLSLSDVKARLPEFKKNRLLEELWKLMDAGQ